jgi:hypothetical protein
VVAPEIKVDALAVLCFGGFELQVPVKVSDVIVELDLQLIVRMSEEQGMTMLGVMLNEAIEIDYHLSVFGMIGVSSIPAVQSYVNNAINDSLWWMRKPNVLKMPWVPGAGAHFQHSSGLVLADVHSDEPRLLKTMQTSTRSSADRRGTSGWSSYTF